MIHLKNINSQITQSTFLVVIYGYVKENFKQKKFPSQQNSQLQLVLSPKKYDIQKLVEIPKKKSKTLLDFVVNLFFCTTTKKFTDFLEQKRRKMFPQE